MDEKLKPCPFCGGTFVAQGASRDYISVWCDCGARGPEVKFPENCDPVPPIRECYIAWNRRALSAAAQPGQVVTDAMVERARQAVLHTNVFISAEHMRAALEAALLPTPAGESEREPVAWTDEAIIELAVAHSNYRDEAGFEVMSHARIVEFARELLAAPKAVTSPAQGTVERAEPVAETLPVIVSRAASVICEVGALCGWPGPECKSEEAAQALFDAGLLASPPVDSDALKAARRKLELWFFRDLVDRDRLVLFSIFGLPVDEIGTTHGHQQKALKHVVAALSSQGSRSDE